MTYQRTDNRTHDQIRNTKITPNISPYAEGSALIEVGGTKVICTASVEDRVPMFLRNKGLGCGLHLVHGEEVSPFAIGQYSSIAHNNAREQLEVELLHLV